MVFAIIISGAERKKYEKKNSKNNSGHTCGYDDNDRLRKRQ